MNAHVCCILSSCADVFLRGWALRVGLSIQPPCMSAHVCCILSSCADVFLSGGALRVGLSIQPPCMSTCVYTCTLYYAAVLTSYVYNNGNA